MSMLVYPRLGDVLAAKALSVPELERELEKRFGVSVEPEALYRLALGGEPLRQVNIEVIAAAAAVLGVTLDELFSVQATSQSAETAAESPVLEPARERRLRQLLDRQSREDLPELERNELHQIIADYSERLHERRIGEIAARQGISLDLARRDSAAQIAEALRWWRAVDADPERRRAIVGQGRAGTAE